LYPYPVRKSKTCPRANRVCSKAKRDEVFDFKRAQFLGCRLMLQSIKIGDVANVAQQA
jgi:hypothetical protein